MTTESEALRKIAEILDTAGLFFDVDLVAGTAGFTIERSHGSMDSPPIITMTAPVLDGDTFRDIAAQLEIVQGVLNNAKHLSSSTPRSVADKPKIVRDK